jgi:hypothetical protein
VKGSPHLTEKQLGTLAIVARDKHALLFDLEVQELMLLGLIEAEDGALLLTRQGHRMLAARGCRIGARAAAQPVPDWPILSPRPASL